MRPEPLHSLSTDWEAPSSHGAAPTLHPGRRCRTNTSPRLHNTLEDTTPWKAVPHQHCTRTGQTGQEQSGRDFDQGSWVARWARTSRGAWVARSARTSVGGKMRARWQDVGGGNIWAVVRYGRAHIQVRARVVGGKGRVVGGKRACGGFQEECTHPEARPTHTGERLVWSKPV